ncbi:Golgi-associated RAB2 interactor protein 5B [Hippopotamus amphibius kiboko]|uniref:Golgi-associated RAB2 interactor protein 5B n=1 Tax=Hippopotamus amphibius kiboko TaxID=575201 RepID=UPI002599F446|nr:Golgi-associated RAB2 interactor protein 5B [Hippopotamus amphibius kiboko]
MNQLRNIRRLEPLQGPPKWVPALGELQKTLQKGEYLPLRPLPMFESNFVQVTNRGAPVLVHHRTNRVTMGVAASLPGLVLPDILLIAQPPEGRECSHLVLTRMIPLDLAHLYVHDLSAWRLKLRLVTGRYYYLELDAPDSEVGFLFDRWIRLINLLQQPATSWAPRTLHTPPVDLAHVAPPASTWRLQDPAHHRRSVMIARPTFPYKILTTQRQRKAKTLKRKFKSQAVGDSVPLIWSQLEQADARKKSTEKKPQIEVQVSGELNPSLCLHEWTPEMLTLLLRAQTAFSPPEKPSITIRTIFSIFSNTPNRMVSSSKRCSDSEGATCLAGLHETPACCISEDSPEMPLLSSCDHLDMYLWQQDMDDLMDPESSTLSTSSLCPAAYPPDCLGCNGKARPLDSGQRLWPPPSQKPPAVPAASCKAPFILDQTQKVSAAPAPPQKISTAPCPPWKASALLAAPQEAPATPGPSRKTPRVPAVPHKAPAAPAKSRKAPRVPAVPHKAPAVPAESRKAPRVPAVPHKAPAVPAESRKAPRVPAVPPKAVSPPALKRKSVFLPTPSQKAVTLPTQYQMTMDPANVSVLPVGRHGGDVLEKSKPEGKPEPVMLMGTQETNIVEMRTQKTSLELPFTTTKKESEEVLVSRAQEITVDGLKGKGKLEDKVLRMKEEISLDRPGFKSKEVGQRKKWVKTQELAIEGDPQGQTRPFSVEGLTLAKLMITASSKDPSFRSALINLPSWLSTQQGSAMPAMGTVPLHSTKVSRPEKTPVAVREQSQFGAWAKGNTRPWAEVEEVPEDPKGPSKVAPCPKRATSSSTMNVASLTPIPLPSVRWEDVPESPASLTPISKWEARVSQQPRRVSQELKRVPDQCPVATVGSSLEILLPTLLEIETMKDTASEVEKIKEELGVFAPSARYLG